MDLDQYHLEVDQEVLVMMIIKNMLMKPNINIQKDVKVVFALNVEKNFKFKN